MPEQLKFNSFENSGAVPDFFPGRSRYPGGKGGAGTYQTVINMIPPHDTFIETHLGGGAVMRHKRPAAKNIGIDVDPDVIAGWLSLGRQDLILINIDATRFLFNYPFTGNEFVYADPPYVRSSRKSGRPLYKHEYTDDQHRELLACLKSLPCKVMVSGYWSQMYADALADWNSHTFEAATRRGVATEWLWFNYPVPETLHDYSYLGADYRERERIKRKRIRWVNRLESLPALERNALLNALTKLETS